jgi:hypothetical protein
VLDHDENSALNSYERFLARPGHTLALRVRCAA